MSLCNLQPLLLEVAAKDRFREELDAPSCLDAAITRASAVAASSGVAAAN